MASIYTIYIRQTCQAGAMAFKAGSVVTVDQGIIDALTEDQYYLMEQKPIEEPVIEVKKPRKRSTKKLTPTVDLKTPEGE